MKKKLLVLGSLIFLLYGCSGGAKPPTCDVYVSGNQVHVVIDLPAEGMDYHDTHDLTPAGFTGTPAKMEINSGGSTTEYSQTGNSYEISYSVTYENGDISNYQISIKGSVYGDEEYTCSK